MRDMDQCKAAFRKLASGDGRVIVVGAIVKPGNRFALVVLNDTSLECYYMVKFTTLEFADTITYAERVPKAIAMYALNKSKEWRKSKPLPADKMKRIIDALSRVS